MKRVLFLAMVLTLSACGYDQPAPVSADDAPTKEVPPAKVEVSTPEASDKIPLLVQRLIADGRGHFRHDRVRDDREGNPERRVFVEMIGMTDVEAADVTEGILDSLGFEQGRRNDGEGGVRLMYKAPDGSDVRVLVRSRAVHSKLQHDEATSSVLLRMPASE